MIEVSMRAIESVLKGTEHEHTSITLTEIRRVFEALSDAAEEGPSVPVVFVP